MKKIIYILCLYFRKKKYISALINFKAKFYVSYLLFYQLVPFVLKAGKSDLICF